MDSLKAKVIALASLLAPTSVVAFLPTTTPTPAHVSQHDENGVALSRARLPKHVVCAGPRQRRSRMNGWVGDIWEEMIEMATYGPGERRILAERRKRAAALEGAEVEQSAGEEKVMSFAEARKRYETVGSDDDEDISEDDLSPAAFRQAAAAVASRNETSEPSLLEDFDGYALRDLLVNKWGAPLDIDFQRDASLSNVYCNILPIAFGQRLKCRHETELEYLMHLQGIVEVLRKYDQLEAFVTFVEETDRRPKAGTDSVPYRLNLNEEQKRQIL